MPNDKALFKFSLTKENPVFSIVDIFKGWLDRSDRNIKVDRLVFKLMEVSECNPSDLTLTYSFNGQEKLEINLYEYRTNFIFQNGFYLLNITEVKDFDLDTEKTNLVSTKPKLSLAGFNATVLNEGKVTFYGYATNPEFQR